MPERDWTKPQAMALAKGGYIELKPGKYGPIFPKTPACYGFTIIAKIKPGREETIRGYANTIEIDFVFAMERTTLHPMGQQSRCGIAGCNLQYVQVGSWPRKPINHGDDESSHSM